MRASLSRLNPRPRVRTPWVWTPLFLWIAASSCQRIDWAGMRRDQADRFSRDLVAKTSEAIPTDHALTLLECVRIAQANNLDIRVAEIESRLARLDRKIAFSAFLPALDANVQSVALDHAPTLQFMGTAFEMSDKETTELAIQAQMPIFMPQAWLAYSAVKKAEEARQFITERTRQIITLQVAAYYLGVLATQSMETSLIQGVAEAETVVKEAEAFLREGLATASQLEEAKALLISRQKALSEQRRALRRMQSSLLQAMGVSPLAEISLADAPRIELPEATIEERALEALLKRPELGIADRVIEIRKDEVKIAIANFLPNIVGVGGFSATTESHLVYSSIWSVGIAGVLSVFDGFANVWEYRAAKEKREEAFVKREQTCMAILWGVLQAQLNEESARDALVVAEQALKAAEAKATEVKAQWEQGLVQGSDYLGVLTRTDTAKFQRNAAGFQHQVTIATLMDVMGEGRH